MHIVGVVLLVLLIAGLFCLLWSAVFQPEPKLEPEVPWYDDPSYFDYLEEEPQTTQASRDWRHDQEEALAKIAMLQAEVERLTPRQEESPKVATYWDHLDSV